MKIALELAKTLDQLAGDGERHTLLAGVDARLHLSEPFAVARRANATGGLDNDGAFNSRP